MDKECKSYIKVLYKKSEQIYKNYYHIVFLEMFQLILKGLKAKKKYYVEGTSKNFEKIWAGNLWEIESKCRDLLVDEYCKKLYHLMDSF